MKKGFMRLHRPDPEEEKAIRRGIERDADTRELSEEDFANMQPASEVMPDLVAAHEAGTRMKRKKQTVVVQLDEEVVAFFRASSSPKANWKKRIDEVLRAYVRARTHS